MKKKATKRKRHLRVGAVVRDVSEHAPYPFLTGRVVMKRVGTNRFKCIEWRDGATCIITDESTLVEVKT
jgi:hypothetical protein